jgi:hypothetical protein
VARYGRDDVCTARETARARSCCKGYLTDKILGSEDLVHQNSNSVDVFIAYLDEDGTRIGKKVLSHGQAIS